VRFGSLEMVRLRFAAEAAFLMLRRAAPFCRELAMVAASRAIARDIIGGGEASLRDFPDFDSMRRVRGVDVHDAPFLALVRHDKSAASERAAITVELEADHRGLAIALDVHVLRIDV
jgi:hypothetical protein